MLLVDHRIGKITAKVSVVGRKIDVAEVLKRLYIVLNIKEET